MEKAIALMEGEWRGTAWVELEPQHRSSLDLTIAARPKSDGTALLVDVSYRIEPAGTAAGAKTPAAPHNEMAVLYFDEQAQAYGFDIFFSTGRHEVGSGHLESSVLQIESPLANGGRRRITLDRSQPDEWREKAEVAPDGVHWRTYYDSALRRVGP